jgi:hypothetical protein
MKQFLSFTLLIALAALVMALSTESASAQTSEVAKGKTTPVVKWGGFDDDGDGILNCQDPDYVPPRDGTGRQLGKMRHAATTNLKGGFGPGDGTGNQGERPLDGTGYGKTRGTGVNNLGICDGTGPKGKGRAR